MDNLQRQLIFIATRHMKREEARIQWKMNRNFGNKRKFYDWALRIIESEPKKSGEILRRRFGIGIKGPQTLEEIGKSYGVTRERVRQIINDSLRRINLNQNNDALREAEEKIIFTIKENYGIIPLKSLVEMLSCGDEREANSLVFFGALSNKIFTVGEKGAIKKSWTVQDDMIEKIKEIDSIVQRLFQKEKILLSDDELLEIILREHNREERKFILSRQQAVSFIHVLEQVRRNKIGKWGMANWKEVSLKGTRERAYMALQKKGEPTHFSDIAKLIDAYHLGKRNAHPQTVHNELIKDDRFVLIGRGIYALKEWGYVHGTVQDVLKEILYKSRESLSQEEIMKRVLQVRKVKPSTIMINLNNSKFFAKEGSFYSLRN